jgi:hypothetical protein
MSKRALARAVVALVIAVVLGGAYAIVARNQAANPASEAPAAFGH